MRTIENLTMVNNTKCVSFRPKNASDPTFITIFNGSGCYAPVSRNDISEGKTFINLARLDLGVVMSAFVVSHCLMDGMPLAWFQELFNTN
jgi:hypothetical protein